MSGAALADLISAVGNTDAAPPLTIDTIRSTRAAAVESVRVPQNIVNLLVDLRTFMQESLEPPAYVSDRRMVKAVQLLQVRCRQCPPR